MFDIIISHFQKLINQLISGYRIEKNALGVFSFGDNAFAWLQFFDDRDRISIARDVPIDAIAIAIAITPIIDLILR